MNLKEEKVFKGIRVTIRLPKSLSESVRRQKINRIYDILTVAKKPVLRYTVNG